MSSGNCRYVISRRMTGLGDRLICLGAAWRYARMTGRTLVVDWRLGEFAQGPAENEFPLYFAVPSQLAGVPFALAERLDADGPAHSLQSTLPNGDRLPEQRIPLPATAALPNRADAVEIIRRGKDSPVATVTFDACVNDGLVELDEARTFLRALEPVPSITDRVATFRRRTLGETPVIGVHVRHGNGGDIMAHQPHWTSFDEALNRCCAAVEFIRDQAHHAWPVFLCTDSIEVQDEFSKRVPDVFTRPKSFRPPGEGELHLSATVRAQREDALVEMLLLAHCRALVRYPPGSFFSFYAAAMLAANSGNLQVTYDLHRPWTASDPLAPAIIMR